ncbi:MAG: hypothetical protein ACOYN0_16610 [Phycisphaerales bacterium]
MSRAIDLSDLPKPLADAIEAMVRTFREGSAAGGGGGVTPRPIGWAKDILPELPASFFDPLPPDILDQFEGHAA